jgi:hypothetical protein
MEAKSLTPCINVMNAKMPHVINSNEVKTSVTLAITLSIKTSGRVINSSEVKTSVTLDFCNSCRPFAN